MIDHLPTVGVERRRLCVARHLDSATRAEFGQVFTPAPVARFIASMLNEFPAGGSVRLLDPGAGVGCLAAAAVERLVLQDGVHRIDVVAYEIDSALHAALRASLTDLATWAESREADVSWEIREGSYLDVGTLQDAGYGVDLGSFDAVIMNPPYGKLGARSPERRAMEQLGVQVANLYTAFLALGVLHLREGGTLAAITPRSFANGVYHEPFRRFFFEVARISRVHLFEARDLVFADSNVLQENLVLSVSPGVETGSVLITSSRGPEDAPVGQPVPYDEVVSPNDPHQFLRIPTERRHRELADWMANLPMTLGDLGLSVSTGRVVEFRAREFLSDQIEAGVVPLIHPAHLNAGRISWPLASGGMRPNALVVNDQTERLLLPNEPYVVVKRFSSKEERRRVSAAVSSPELVPGSRIAFENHLNVLHRGGLGLEPDLAFGLATFLNSSLVDDYVRLFSGHTQINATDLRNLRYPSITQLSALGSEFRAFGSEPPPIDRLVDRIVRGVGEAPPASSVLAARRAA